jgi:hypothetical protein
MNSMLMMVMGKRRTLRPRRWARRAKEGSKRRSVEEKIGKGTRRMEMTKETRMKIMGSTPL